MLHFPHSNSRCSWGVGKNCIFRIPSVVGVVLDVVVGWIMPHLLHLSGSDTVCNYCTLGAAEPCIVLLHFSHSNSSRRCRCSLEVTFRLLHRCDCSLSLWRVVRGSKLMHLDLIHGLFIT